MKLGRWSWTVRGGAVDGYGMEILQVMDVEVGEWVTD